MKNSITKFRIRWFLIFCLLVKTSLAWGNSNPATYYSSEEDPALYSLLPDKSVVNMMEVNEVIPYELSPEGRRCITPIILVPPINASVCLASAAVLTVVALNATGYQWQVNTGSGYTNVTNGPGYSGANTATLSVLNVSGNITGYTYRVIVYGDCTSVTSGDVNVELLSPYITQNPAAATLCAGGNTSFTAAAGLATAYQWQVNTGSSYVNVSNGGVYSGATTTTLTITGATSAMNGYRYRLVASGLCAPAAQSSGALLTVNFPPTISQNPATTSICSGGNTFFRVIAAGGGLTYHWQVDTGSGYTTVTNGGVYSGANSSTLNITGATAGMNGYLYRSIVTGACSPAATSPAGTLTITPAPAITQHPSPSSVCTGGNTTFTVATSGAGLTYQWQVDAGAGFVPIANGGVYSGANTTTLSIISATPVMDGYSYRAVVSGTCSPAATSSPAILTISSPPAITQNPAASAICSGGNTTFTTAATGGGLTYQWQVDNGSGFTAVSNGGVYSGASTATLSITAATSGMNGYLYRAVVSGTCSPAATSAAAALTINASPAITQNPAAAATCIGGNTTFTVTASGGGLAYQWQVDSGSGFTAVSDGGVYSGSNTATLSITAATAGMNGYLYRTVVSGTCSPAATSAAVALTINAAPAITQDPAAASICSGGNTTFAVTASGGGLAYQWQVDSGAGFTSVSNGGVYSGANTATLSITAATAGMNGYLYRAVVSGTCSPAATSASAALTINAAPAITQDPAAAAICSGGNTTFAVTASGTGLTYQWQVDNGAGFTAVSNGGVYSGASTATLSITAATAGMDGYLYRAVVSGTCSPAATSAAAALTINASPAITQNPAAATTCIGGNTTFTVTASGGGLAYQWQVDSGSGFTAVSDGGVYSGSNTATLSITAATAGMNGYLYRAVVSGTCSPAVTSSSSALTINAAPAITQNPAASATCIGGNTTFAVTASGAGLTYQWQVDSGSGFTAVSDGGVYSGSNTATLSITAATAGMNGYSYRAVVSGTCSPAATSTSAALTINAAPSITQNPSPASICEAAGTSFSVTGSGSGLTYQWQVDGGSGYGNVSNGGAYSGATTNTLTISGASLPMSGSLYRVVVSGTCSPAATSSGALLTIQANVTYYQDLDGDGYGNSAVSNTNCSGAPIGYVNNSGDCDDNNANVHPGVVEICGDGIDNDCNGIMDESCPVSQISPIYWGTVLTLINTNIYADEVQGATTYRFRITNGSNVQIVDKTTRNFNFTELPGYAYGTAYTVDVAVKFNGVFGSYGTPAVITTPDFATRVQESQCGISVPSFGTAIYAYLMSFSTQYRFRVTNGSNVQIVENATRVFYFNQLQSYNYSTTYTIDVSALVNGVWTPYGVACNITTQPPLSKVQATQCGATLATISTNITADNIIGATQYRFRVTEGANVQVIDRPTRTFNLTQLTGFNYSTTYSIDVAVEMNGTFGPYGTACNVTSPAVQPAIETAQCGTTLATISTTIYANNVAGATQYRFRVTNGANVQTIDRSTRSFSLNLLTTYAFNTTYSVDVAVLVNGTWTAYGTACNISSPVYALTQLQPASCGATVAMSGSITANSVINTTQYRFRFTLGSNVYVGTSSTRTIVLNTVSGLAIGNTYSVDVAAFYNGVWQPYSTACNVTIGSARPSGNEAVFMAKDMNSADLVFDAAIFPNPFNNEFGISVNTSNTEAISVTVYDMSGKALDMRKVSPEELNTLKMGEGYASGMYQIQVIQGSETKVFKVVKE